MSCECDQAMQRTQHGCEFTGGDPAASHSGISQNDHARLEARRPTDAACEKGKERKKEKGKSEERKRVTTPTGTKGRERKTERGESPTSIAQTNHLQFTITKGTFITSRAHIIYLRRGRADRVDGIGAAVAVRASVVALQVAACALNT